jgi:hypothetical protein
MLPNPVNVNPPAAPRAQAVGPRFVVTREGHRVSVHEYETHNDPKALEEVKYWRNIAKKHSWGEPVEIVQYDNKFHRVW